MTPPGAPAPLAVRRRTTRRELGARLRRWPWESKGPLRTAAARALKSLPFVRKAVLRRVTRPGQQRPA